MPGCLADRAVGAILTFDQAGGPFFKRVYAAEFCDEDICRLSKGPPWGTRKFGLRWPGMDSVVPAGKETETQVQRIARNAWKMLDRIQRRATRKTTDISGNQRPA